MAEDKFREAQAIAFKLLASRGRTAREVENKLIQKGIDSCIIKKTIRYLKDKSYIDDEKFGYNWARYRIENNPIGSIRIEYELDRKGVKNEIVCRILERLKKDFDEIEIASSLARKRIKGITKSLSPVAYKRIFGYLMRRGFPQEVIGEVLRKYKWE